METVLSALISSTGDTTLTTAEALIYAVLAGGLGLIISLTYVKTGRTSKNFARTLIILPMLVCVVMLAVNGNFGTSLAVVGAFSLVRFRSLQEALETLDSYSFAMTVGIVCAIGELSLAIIITFVISAIHFILYMTKYASASVDEKDLRITIPENLDYYDIFDDIFNKYTSEYKQIAVRTTNMGSMYEINYRVKLIDEKLEKSFIDEIRMRNGNLTVICGRCDVNEAEEL